MFDANKLEELSRKVADAMPANLKVLKEDFDKQLHHAMQSVFSKMDLVTREEFEVQEAVLARTRSKLDSLEKQLAELEQRL